MHARSLARSYHAQNLQGRVRMGRCSFQKKPHQVSVGMCIVYLGMTAGPRAASAHPIITSWPTCLLEARTKPRYTPHPVCRSASATATTTPSQLVSSHRALGTEHTGHWALGALGKASAVSSTSRPLYSNFRTHFTLPRFSPALQTRQTRAVRNSVPSAHFEAPEHATRLLAFITRTLRGSSHLTHASAATDQGAGRHILSHSSPSPPPFPSGAPLQVISARRSSTPLPPFGIGPPNTSTLPL